MDQEKASADALFANLSDREKEVALKIVGLAAEYGREAVVAALKDYMAADASRTSQVPHE